MVAVSFTPTGAVLPGWITMSKLPLADKLPASVSVTLTVMVPAGVFAGGVPLKVRVLALKLNHDGSALPSAKVAL